MASFSSFLNKCPVPIKKREKTNLCVIYIFFLLFIKKKKQTKSKQTSNRTAGVPSLRASACRLGAQTLQRLSLFRGCSRRPSPRRSSPWPPTSCTPATTPSPWAPRTEGGREGKKKRHTEGASKIRRCSKKRDRAPASGGDDFSPT